MNIKIGFRGSTSKMKKRRCYSYDTALDGTLIINRTEARVVIWIFERYLQRDGLGEMLVRWSNREAHPHLVRPSGIESRSIRCAPNEKYTEGVLFQRIVSTGVRPLKSDGFTGRYLLPTATRLSFPRRFLRLYRRKSRGIRVRRMRSR